MDLFDSFHLRSFIHNNFVWNMAWTKRPPFLHRHFFFIRHLSKQIMMTNNSSRRHVQPFFHGMQ